MSGAMAKDRPFSYEDIKYAKSFLTKVWNAARFVETCGKPKLKTQDRQNGAPFSGPQNTKPSMIDRWILGKLNTLIRECTLHMQNFEYHYAIGKMHSFFWHDFCDNYLEYVKHRIYGDGETKDAAIYTLNTVLLEFIRLFAPIAPHISEEVYHELFGKESIHHQAWPKGGEEYKEDVEKVAVLNEVVSQLRQHKSRNKLPQNAELELVRLSLPQEMDAELLDELAKISKIKKVETVKGEFGVSV
jgi:valyl-tRNA synthetase